MARSCTVCASPDLDSINVELAGGGAAPPMALRYGVSSSALLRHKARHLTPAIVRIARQKRNEASAGQSFDTVLPQLRTLADDLSQLFDIAIERKSLVGGAQVARELRGCIELLARLTGELDERARFVTLNVLASAEVSEMVGRLLSALGPWPEAKVAAAAALEAIEVEAVTS